MEEEEEFLFNFGEEEEIAEQSNNSPKECELFEAVKDGILSEVTRLIEKEYIDVNCRDESSRTPLHHASFYNHVSIVSFLIESNAQVDGLTTMEETPMYLAANEGNLEVMKILINANARLDVPSKLTLDTALHAALKHNHWRVGLLLVMSSARTDLKNAEGKTAKDVAKFEMKQIFAFCPPKKELLKKRKEQDGVIGSLRKKDDYEIVKEEEDEKVSVDWYEVHTCWKLLEEKITHMEERNMRLKLKNEAMTSKKVALEKRSANTEMKYMQKQHDILRKKFGRRNEKLKKYRERIEKLKNQRDGLKLTLRERENAVEGHLREMNTKLGEEGFDLQKEMLAKSTLNKQMGRQLSEKMKHIKHMKEVDEIRKAALKEKDQIIAMLEKQLDENGLKMRCQYCKNYKPERWFRCGFCKTLYCSQECQKKDWVVNRHKSKCAELKKERESGK